MKLIKKIAAIMFAFMMVFSLSTNVKATSGSQTDGNKGTITINNAIDGQEYRIYKIFDLESFDTEQTPDGAYLYKITDAWRDFFTNGEGQNYVTVDDNDYVTWKNGVSKDKAAELSKKALDYAKNTTIQFTKKTIASGTTATFGNLAYGYYLVDSSIGALCGLTTTNPTVSIQEKNEVPTLTKTVRNVSESANFGRYAHGSIGDEFEFKINFTVKKGVQKYVVHDKMSNTLTLNVDSFSFKNQDGAILDTLYALKTINTGDDCTFDITFYEVSLQVNDNIEITYKAKLNESADILCSGDVHENKNTAWLTFGDKGKSIEAYTNVYTYRIPVFKFTTKDGAESGLPKAKFTLSTDKEGQHKISFVRKGNEGDYVVYRKAEEGETGAVEEIITETNGKFMLVGLHGTYYLTETKAPEGYNKLKEPYTIYVSEGGGLLLNGTLLNPQIVKVENKSGSILPSTGGMGTTLIYLIGGALVLGSGFVLANKKRAKAK